MEKVELIKRYYNGKINVGAVSNEKTIIKFDGESLENSVIITERTYYSDEHTQTTISGTCKLTDFFDDLGEKRSAMFQISNLINKFEKVVNTYSPDFVEENPPANLIPYVIRIDEKYFEYANRDTSNENYKFAVALVNFNPLLNLNNKMLKSVLNSELFSK
ncbi:MAG: hypothetical protein IJE91_03200 [Clostridia bacterium]|nr:hypothetical protein [Clostridia bacterium]